MGTTRRDFLKALGATAVAVTAVLPPGVEMTKEPPVFVSSWETSDGLQRRFQATCLTGAEAEPFIRRYGTSNDPPLLWITLREAK
jgi:hypothetical protein